MFKKYNKIEDYFVDKEQLKRYKNHLLAYNEKIILSNKEHFCDLNINIDNFENCILIFQNSTFNSLSLSNFNISSFPKIEFNNCEIYDGNVYLNPLSRITINNSKILKLNANAKYININNIEQFYQFYRFDLYLGNENTESISLTNINCDLPVFNNFNTVSKILKLDNSRASLSSKCDILYSKNSKIDVKKIDASKQIYLSNSIINDNSSSDLDIASPILVTTGTNRFENNELKVDYLIVNNYSTIQSNNSIFDVNKKLILKRNSDIKGKDSYLNVENIIMDPNSDISISDIEYTNNDNEKQMSIQPKKMQQEREKLVKTLRMIENKYNKPIKDLRG